MYLFNLFTWQHASSPLDLDLTSDAWLRAHYYVYVSRKLHVINYVLALTRIILSEDPTQTIITLLWQTDT